jgi:hypothetical protein
MTDPDLESEKRPTRSEMLAELVWIIGPIGALWLGLKIVTTLFPLGNRYLLAASVVIPEAAVLYGIGLWRRRNSA